MASSKKSIEAQVAEIVNDNEGNLTAEQIAGVIEEIANTPGISSAADVVAEIERAAEHATAPTDITTAELAEHIADAVGISSPADVAEVEKVADEMEAEFAKFDAERDAADHDYDRPGELVATIVPLPTVDPDRRVTLTDPAIGGGTVTGEFEFDMAGNYAGGRSFGRGIEIRWQNGPAPTYGWNGATIEDVLAAASQRLRFFQIGQFACDENAEAIGNIERAIAKLNERTLRRQHAGTEGTYEGN